MSLRVLLGLALMLLVTGCAASAASAPIETVTPQRIPVGTLATETQGRPRIVLNQDVQMETYSVAGRSVDEIRDDLNKKRPFSAADNRRFDANALWSLSWSFHFDKRPDSCSLIDATVTLVVRVQMPELADDADRPDSVTDDWKRFLQMLETHEAGHVQHYTQAAAALQEAYRIAGAYENCDELRSVLSDVGAQQIESVRLADVQYDQTTDHGRLQGANFP